jgi:hypothetical protein
MTFNSPPRKPLANKQFSDPAIHKRPQRPVPLNKRDPRHHFRHGVINEYGIPVPSQVIEDYIPGIHNNIQYTTNNLSSRNPDYSYARRQMQEAQNLYQNLRHSQYNSLEQERENGSTNWRAKRQKTRKGRKTRAKKTRKSSS